MKFDSVEEFTQALINNNDYYFVDESGDAFYFEDGDLYFTFNLMGGIVTPVGDTRVGRILLAYCVGREFNMVEKLKKMYW